MRALYLDRLKQNRIRDLSRLADAVQLNPTYQREGGVWDFRKRRLLIDSILNGYDVPKVYLRHFVPALEEDRRVFDFAVIDGQQRLSTIWSFLDDDFAVGADFTYNDDETLSGMLAGLRFSEISLRYPDIANQFLNYELDVITVETTEDDYIEDMFLRLNEAVPLNAAEKRNAFHGPIPPAARALAQHTFFTCVKVSGRRYRYFDLATKFLFFEAASRVRDTKKVALDRFVKSYEHSAPSDVDQIVDRVGKNLDALTSVFVVDDPLLSTVGMIVAYYAVAMTAVAEGWWSDIDRSDFVRFEQKRATNKIEAAAEEGSADSNLLEFERFAQSPNDAIAIRFRRDVLLEFLGHPSGEPLLVGSQ